MVQPPASLAFKASHLRQMRAGAGRRRFCDARPVSAPRATGWQSPLFGVVVVVGTWFLRRVFLGYFDVRVRGLENVPVTGPAIIAGNHPSVIDGLLLYLVSPVRLQFIAHRELFRHPLTGWLIRGLGFINAMRHRNALEAGTEALRLGEILVIFPEGGPYEAGRMEQIHQGVGLLALRSGAPVIPLGIAGAAEAFPLASYLPFPGTIIMRLGKPFRYPVETAEKVPDETLMGTLVDIRRHILHTEREAQRELDAAPVRPRGRRLKVLISAVFLLPLVAIITVMAKDLKARPTD